MLAYWMIFTVPVVALFMPYRADKDLKRFIIFAVASFFIIIIIGFRYQVSGDWYSYLEHYTRVIGETFYFSIITNDPAYGALNWISTKFNGGVCFVNVVCATIFTTGLLKFAMRQQNFWLSLVAAIPYLVIVVSMGYTRQAVAIGFVLCALASVEIGHTKRYFFYIILGTLFHKTAIVMLPFGFLAKNLKLKLIDIFFLCIILLILALFIIIPNFQYFWVQYVINQMESSGGSIRVFMNSVAGLCIIFFGSKLRLSENAKGIYKVMSWFTIMLLPFTFIISVAVDRLTLYMIPLQLLIAGNCLCLFKDKNLKHLLFLGVIFLYTLVLFVWLNFATHAPAWIPYKNILIEQLL